MNQLQLPPHPPRGWRSPSDIRMIIIINIIIMKLIRIYVFSFDDEKSNENEK